MKRMKIIPVVCAALLLLPLSLFSQYRISIHVPDFPHDTLIFGNYFNETIMIADTFLTDSEGNASIRGEKLLPEGMYTVYFPNKSRLDLLIGRDQDFTLSTDTSDMVENTRFKGSHQNQAFYDYLTYLGKKRKETLPYQQILKNPPSPADSSEARQALNKINNQVKSYVQTLIEVNQGSFLSVFLRSMKEIEVPDPPRDENGIITDSSFQARYYKQHYWDNFDLSDVRLLRTPLYEKKLKTWLDRWVYPEPDSVYREVDRLIEKSRSDTLLFKYMLTTLFNYYAKSKYVGMDAVYAYIAEKYYIPEATWSDPEFIGKLKERVHKIDPLIIGKKAPDIRLVHVSDDHFRAAAEDTALKRNPYVGDFFNLSSIKSKFLIVYFWEADCGHCQKAIPVLHQVYDRLKDQGLEVVAVSMLGGVEGKEKWINFVNENGLYGWINAWNPYDYSYRDAFDVNSSNIIYLLDRDKKIIAKRIDPEQAEKIIENELKQDLSAN